MLAPRHQPPSFPEIPGIKDLHTLVIAFLDQPKDIKKFMSDWLKLQKGYEKAVERYREVGSLDGLIAEAEKNKTDTAATLEAARVNLADSVAETARAEDKARGIVVSAHTQAAQIVADEREAIDTVKSGLKASAKDLKAREGALQTDREALDADRAAFEAEKTAALAEMEAKQTALTIEGNVLAERRRKINEAMA